jgi:hypothetical protein
MVGIATHPDASLEPRGRLYGELAHYVCPKRKAVQLSDDPDAPPPRAIVHIVPSANHKPPGEE